MSVTTTNLPNISLSPGIPGEGRGGGFLLVELLMGLVIVALVMLGAAAIMIAVAQGWNDQDVTRSTQVQANQTYIRVQNALQSAKFIGYVTPSSSQTGSIFFWQNDSSGGVELGDPYVSEMALIQYDSTTKTLWLYQVPASQVATAQAQQPSPLTLSQINQSSEATWFTQQPYVEKQALGGPGNGTNDINRLDVEGFQLNVNSLSSSTQLPIIEYAISFSRGSGTTLTLYNTTTLRGPATPQ